jgi:hypothetical protein
LRELKSNWKIVELNLKNNFQRTLAKSSRLILGYYLKHLHPVILLPSSTSPPEQLALNCICSGKEAFLVDIVATYSHPEKYSFGICKKN